MPGPQVGLSHHSTRVVLPGAAKNFYVRLLHAMQHLMKVCHSPARPLKHGRLVQADLTTGEGLKEALSSLSPVDVVINCAAVSQPALCERDEEFAR